MTCGCICHTNGAYPPPCPAPGGCGLTHGTEYEHGRCVATQDCQNRQAPGLLICRGHLERLSAMLREVEDEAAILSAAPSMQQKRGSRGGSPASERAPARLAVIAFRDPQTRRWTRDEQPRYTPPSPKSYGPWCLFCDHDSCKAWRAGRQRDLHDDEYDAGSDRLMSILGVLNGWARVIREDRDLSSPEQVTVTSERDTLSRHLDWAAAQPFIDEMYAEIRDLAAALKSLNGTAADKPVGRCYLPGDDQDGTCGGNIWRLEEPSLAWLPLADRCVRTAVQVADGPARCDRCGNLWDGPEVQRLTLILEQAKRPKATDGRPMVTAAEIAQQMGITVNAVYLRLSRAKIRAVNGYYDPAVLRVDVAS